MNTDTDNRITTDTGADYDAAITSWRDAASTVRILTVRVLSHRPYAFHPGQYAQLTFEGLAPRPFSIASAPRPDNTFDIHVRNTGGAVSGFLCSDAIVPGMPVTVSPSGGRMHIRPDQGRTVLIAGGTGIAPFFAAIEAFPDAPLTVFWGAERQEDFYLRPTGPNLEMRYCLDQYPIDAYLESAMHPGDRIYLSGPPPMIGHSRARLLAAGIERYNIFYDGDDNPDEQNANPRRD